MFLQPFCFIPNLIWLLTAAYSVNLQLDLKSSNNNSDHLLTGCRKPVKIDHHFETEEEHINSERIYTILFCSLNAVFPCLNWKWFFGGDSGDFLFSGGACCVCTLYQPDCCCEGKKTHKKSGFSRKIATDSSSGKRAKYTITTMSSGDYQVISVPFGPRQNQHCHWHDIAFNNSISVYVLTTQTHTIAKTERVFVVRLELLWFFERSIGGHIASSQKTSILMVSQYNF